MCIMCVLAQSIEIQRKPSRIKGPNLPSLPISLVALPFFATAQLYGLKLSSAKVLTTPKPFYHLVYV
ncbi:hypothetical protein Hanom_Chr14g01266911 [Helianthus anomalus]